MITTIYNTIQKIAGLWHFSFFLMLRKQVTGAWPPPVAGGAISEPQHCCGSIQLLDRCRGRSWGLTPGSGKKHEDKSPSRKS